MAAHFGTKAISGIGGGVLFILAGIVAVIELLAFLSDEIESIDAVEEGAAY